MHINQKTKKILKFLLKLTVSSAAIAFVVSKIDLTEIWSTIKTVDSTYLIIALLVYATSQILSALRLNTLFATMPLPLGTAMNMRLYWLGMFYNFFLPGGIGGDGYKVYYLNRYYRQHVKNLIAVIFSDRLSGLVAIGIYLLIFSSFFVENLPIPLREYLYILIPFAFGAYYLFLYIVKRSATPVVGRVMLYSLLIQGLQMGAATLILFSLGVDSCSIDSYLFLFLVSSIASAIPITLGGIGAREMTFVIGSSILGTNEGLAVSLSVLFYVVSLVSSFPGIAYALKPKLIEGKKPHRGTEMYVV